MQLMEPLGEIRENSAMAMLDAKRKRSPKGFLEAFSALLAEKKNNNSINIPTVKGNEKAVPGLAPIASKARLKAEEAPPKSMKAASDIMPTESKNRNKKTQMQAEDNLSTGNVVLVPEENKTRAVLPKKEKEVLDASRLDPGKDNIRHEKGFGAPDGFVSRLGIDAAAQSQKLKQFKTGQTPGDAMTERVFEVTKSGFEKTEKGKNLAVIDLRMKSRAEKNRDQFRDKGHGNTGISEEELLQKGSENKTLSISGNMTGENSAIYEKNNNVHSWYEKSGTPDAKPGSPLNSAFTESLTARLRDGAGDIVSSARIVLKDAGSGVIRLRLEPETLGGVKIELKMSEKQISGKIIVESDMAGEAFRASLDALRDAFTGAGLNTGSLEVEVRNGMGKGSNSGMGQDEDKRSIYWSRSLEKLDSAVPAATGKYNAGLLNLFV
ncbi:hypothetical protein MASR2M29_12380 [Spirochaetota bacterium]